MSPSTLAISYFFHLVATVFWLGGLVIMVLLVLPTARQLVADQPLLYALLNRLRRRFVPLSNLSLAVLVATGLIQMSGDPNYDGLLTFDNEWSRVMLLKHFAIIGMVVCMLFAQLTVAPALDRALLLLEKGKQEPAAMAKLHRDETRLTWINVGLSMVVLLFTAWATAL
ncbi:MAG: CopD family protein [Chloroflexi bacterium]|nr:CopD family protein [Chloroflexota bacterium]